VRHRRWHAAPEALDVRAVAGGKRPLKQLAIGRVNAAIARGTLRPRICSGRKQSRDHGRELRLAFVDARGGIHKSLAGDG